MLKHVKGLINPFNVLVVTSIIALSGCNTTSNAINKNTTSKDKAIESKVTKNKIDLSLFVGCYTIDDDRTAQIRISKVGYEWMMQMKEPPTANYVWDAAETLEIINKNQASKLLSIDPSNINASIARPDRMLVLAHIEPVYVNIDPYLNSEYIALIDRSIYEIYQVECDAIKISF